MASDVPEWAAKEADSVVPCFCDEAWIDRGLHGPECAKDYVPEVARALAAAYQRGREEAGRTPAVAARIIAAQTAERDLLATLDRARRLMSLVAGGVPDVSEKEAMRVEQELLHAIAAIRAGGA